MEDRYSAVRAAGLAPSTTMLVVKAVCADEVRRIPILNKVRPASFPSRRRGIHVVHVVLTLLALRPSNCAPLSLVLGRSADRWLGRCA